MNAIMYLLQVNLYLLLFYLLYFLILCNETFFKMNRYYLVGSAILSMAIPLTRLNWVKELFFGETVFEVSQRVHNVITSESLISNTANINDPSVSSTIPSFSNLQLLAFVYCSITLLLVLNLLRKLYLVRYALQSNQKDKAFSFFSKVIVDDKLEGKEIIVNHEMVHVRQWHSLDVIFFEIFAAFNWFNPIAFMYKKAIKDIHEFIADEDATASMEDKSAYTLLLVSNVFGTKPQQLTNNFFNQSLLKRRIIMLHKTKSRQVAILKYGLSVPLFVSMVIFSSATATAEKLTKAIETSPVIEILAKTNSLPIQEVESRNFKKKMAPIKTIKTKPIPSNEEVIKKNKVVNGNYSNPLENIMSYISDFKAKQSEDDRKDGISYFSFEIDENKNASNYKVVKSLNPDFEKELIDHLTLFKDTVSLKKGIYNFYIGKDYGLEGDDRSTTLDKSIPTVFGFKSSIISTFITNDETKSEAGKIVNYVKVPYLNNPIILVDGKIASYKVTEKGFMLDETIYPKEQKIKVLRGDAAVAAYKEEARSGLILITTH